MLFLSDCTDKYGCTTWTGGNDIQTEGNFIWETSNTPFDYTNWDYKNTDNHYDLNKPVDCVDMFYDGQWNDRPCNFQASFICERWFFIVLLFFSQSFGRELSLWLWIKNMIQPLWLIFWDSLSNIFYWAICFITKCPYITSAY